MEALKSNKGGAFISVAYADVKSLLLHTVFREHKKRKYKLSANGVPIHIATQDQKNEKVEEALVYGIYLDDEDIEAGSW